MKYMTVQKLKGLSALLTIGILVFLITYNNCPAVSQGKDVLVEANDQLKVKVEETEAVIEHAKRSSFTGPSETTAHIEKLSAQVQELETKNSLYKEEVYRLQRSELKHLAEEKKQEDKAKENAKLFLQTPIIPEVSNTVVTDTLVTSNDLNYQQHTTSFEDTLRNCLGIHCFDQKPEGYAYETVGLLAPPFSAGEDIISAITQSGAGVMTSSVHLEYNTHVPAYGYGKNHGWSRIIRLVRCVSSLCWSMVCIDVTCDDNAGLCLSPSASVCLRRVSVSLSVCL